MKKIMMQITNFRLQLIMAIFVGFLIGFLYRSGYFPTSDTMNYSCSCTSSEEDFIRQRLDEAESIWKSGVNIRHKAEIENPTSVTEPWNVKELILIWDFYYPTFNCPHLIERIGRVGDGGKWVCGVSHLKKRAKSCIVYSYGVKDDTSFEEDILSRTDCTLRAFDPTVDPNNVTLTKMYSTRSTFDKIGLGISDTGNIRTLKSEMKIHGDEFIDILKVDVEGGEFHLLPQILQDFPNGFPFGQLLIEIHLSRFPQTNLFLELKSWWESLEKAGLRAFNREPNLYVLYMGTKNPSYFEFSFLNVKIDHTILHG